jgi:hypothetical protein
VAAKGSYPAKERAQYRARAVGPDMKVWTVIGLNPDEYALCDGKRERRKEWQ